MLYWLRGCSNHEKKITFMRMWQLTISRLRAQPTRDTAYIVIYSKTVSLDILYISRSKRIRLLDGINVVLLFTTKN